MFYSILSDVNGGEADWGEADGDETDGGEADGGEADGGEADGGKADGGEADVGFYKPMVSTGRHLADLPHFLGTYVDKNSVYAYA